jgi:hypothetical protein
MERSTRNQRARLHALTDGAPQYTHPLPHLPSHEACFQANERTGVELGKLFSRHRWPQSSVEDGSIGGVTIIGRSRREYRIWSAGGRERVGHREASSGRSRLRTERKRGLVSWRTSGIIGERQSSLLRQRAGAAESVLSTHFTEYNIISQVV